jgi:hypothetical protein
MPKFKYFSEDVSKQDALDVVPDHVEEYKDPVRAVLDGAAQIDGEVYKSGLLVNDDDTPRLWYFYDYRTNRSRAQDYADAA